MESTLLVILAVCESSHEQSTTIGNEQEINNFHENTIEPNDSVDVETEMSEGEVEVTDQIEKPPSEHKEDIQITSGEEAVQYLKQQLKEGKNDDVSFGTDGKLETNNYGSYYTIQLVDIPLRVSGKTGNSERNLRSFEGTA